MNNITNLILESAKAIVALATPIIITLVTDVLAEVSELATGLVAAVATAVVVWLTPNKAREASS